MINKENIKLWVEALQSGEYEQGRFQLCENDKYCCLGVACEVFNKHNPGKLTIKEASSINGKHKIYDESSSFLPKRVSKWLGFYVPKNEEDDNDIFSEADNNVVIKHSNTEYRASFLNDTKILNFLEIAKAIKETYL